MARGDELLPDHKMSNSNSVKGRLEEAQKCKAKGNEHVKEAKWARAAMAYRVALGSWLSGLHAGVRPVEDSMLAMAKSGVPDLKPNEEEQGEVNALALSCYLNLALMELKRKRWGKAVEAADCALRLDPANSKGLYRRGSARLELGDIEGAREDFTKSDPEGTDPSVKQGLRDCDAAGKRLQSKQKKAYSKMFE